MIFESFQSEGKRTKGKTVGELADSNGSKKKKKQQGDEANTPESTGAATPHKEKSKASPEEILGDSIFVTPKTGNEGVVSDTLFFYPEVEKFFYEVIPPNLNFSQKGENQTQSEYNKKERELLK